ncbi:MAG: ribbon-helix-helix protein, CopG family [Candidatus Doudnabacteria bacterium]|nr:ribbon-helix-helix protein, CopG family [Candidatus Doudnabacteria bacterium]
MRSILNISLPTDLKEEVEAAVKSQGYATKSEFFRDLLRSWKEDKLAQELQGSRRAIKSKKGKLLKSLKDLR